MKVLITPTSLSSNLGISALDPLRERGAELVANPYARPMTPNELISALSGVDGVIAGLDGFPAEVFSEAPELKVIARYGVGYDRIDLEAARKAGVRVTNAPGANGPSVSELALGLMFAVARQLPQMSTAVAAGDWPRFQGIELAGRQLGVLGLGAIGCGTAAMARGIGMDVLGFDPGLSDEDITALGITPATLDEIFTRSDVLSLHIPLNEETRNIVSAERIAAMPRGTIIINTARGGLIDEEAAAAALDTGHVFGLGLDAFETEPPRDSLLVGHPRVVATPHSGAHSKESVQRTATAAVENLLRVLDGDEPLNGII
jgi:D-3-phosphoglycerate dehydrogenase / 2-oxoglutarate reductase